MFLVLFLFTFGVASATGPFFLSLNSTTHVIGNDLWNITIGPTYGTKLFYKNKDIVGKAVGHYVSYSMSTKPCKTTFIANLSMQMELHQI